MKKILWIVFLLFCMMGKASALDTIHIRKEATPMFSTKTTAEGNRFNAQLYYLYVGAEIAYCIEPGVDLKDTNYITSVDFDKLGISAQLKSELELIAYYGYSYKNHQNLYYYMATQELIWEKMGAKDIVWNTGSTYLTNVTVYKEEILELIKKHKLLPSFANKEYTFKVGTKNSLIDTNHVLSKFESADIQVGDTDELVFESPIEKEALYQFQSRNSGKNSILFSAEASQKVAIFYLSPTDTHTFTLKIKYEKEKGNISLTKKDSLTGALLKGAKFSVYDENHNFIVTLETDEKGQALFSSFNYGVYYIKEIEAPKGYIQLDEEMEVHLNTPNKAVEIHNTKYEMPITSDIDAPYIKTSFLLLGGGLFLLYVANKVTSL